MQCEQKKCSNIYRKPKLKLEESTLVMLMGRNYPQNSIFVKQYVVNWTSMDVEAMGGLMLPLQLGVFGD